MTFRNILHHSHKSNSQFHPSRIPNHVSAPKFTSYSHFHPLTNPNLESPQNIPHYHKSNFQFHPSRNPNYLSAQDIANPYHKSNSQFDPSRKPNYISPKNTSNHYPKPSSHFHPSRKPNSQFHPSRIPNSISAQNHKPIFQFNPSKKPNSSSDPKTSPKLPNLEFTPITVHETLHSYTNDWKKGLEFFNWVETQSGFEHTSETYNRMIDILGKFFEFDICWDLIARMSKCEVSLLNHETFRVMFKRYVRAHLVNDAIHMFHYKLDEFGMKDEVSFMYLVDALCEYQHVVDAEELFYEDMDGVIKACGFDVCLDTKIYNMILRGWHKVGNRRKCREYWREMDRKGVTKDLFSYSIYMDIECKSGRPLNAMRLYEEMKRRGIALDVVAYNTVIRAVGNSEGVDVAVRMLREMIESRCQPNVVTYNTILKLYCERGRFREVYNMLNEMRDKGCKPNALTFHGLFASSRKPEEIMQLFERMVENGVRPQMDTYVMLMRKYGKWGFLRPVLTIWKKMEEHGVSPDEGAYNALIDALVQKGVIEMARKYDQEMFKKGLSPKPRAELETKPLIATVTGL